MINRNLNTILYIHLIYMIEIYFQLTLIFYLASRPPIFSSGLGTGKGMVTTMSPLSTLLFTVGRSS